MRSKDAFKAYVYEKAGVKKKADKKNRAFFLRSITAFSLVAIVLGVWVYSGVSDNLAAPEAEIMLCELDVESQAENYNFVLETAAADGRGEYGFLYSAEDACAGALMQSKTCASASGGSLYTVANTATEYKGEMESIDFEKYVALVFTESFESHTIQYGENCITVILVRQNAKKTDKNSYTVLLERALYNEKSISVEIR